MRSFVPDYDLVPAGTVESALEMLGSGEGWRPIAGGTDLMVLFNAGRLPNRRLVSVRDITELRRIEVTDTGIILGGCVTYSEIRQSEIMQREFPLLCTAASWTGGVANQNRGTIGGNIVNASPAADSLPALMVYDADLQLASVQGDRWVSYHEFHTGYKQMQIRPDELLCRIRLPRIGGRRQYIRKVGPRKAQAISKVCFAATACLAGNLIRDVRIAIGSVAPIPLRCVQTEAALRGRAITTEIMAQARAIISGEIQPITDIRSTEEYRRTVTSNLLWEFLQTLQ
jgi:CO/xanthine dehydrogenase FAD-binding subunit